VIYVVSGEQCLETQQMGHRLRAGNYFILAPGQTHSGRIQGTSMRGALILLLLDSQHAASHDLTEPPPLTPCK
jgi:quercetin dioxygenase-like cupin family protein